MLKRNDKIPDGYYEMGNYFMRENKNDEALIQYEKALELNPRHYLSWNNIGVIAHKMKNYDKAIACYRKSLEIDSKHRVALTNMGDTLFHLKKYN